MTTKPCPFCGHTVTGQRNQSAGRQAVAAVRCSRCGAVGPIGAAPTKKRAVNEAVRLWNAAPRKGEA